MLVRSIDLISIGVITLIAIHLLGCEQKAPPGPVGVQPNPSLGPGQVIKLQLDALQSNDATDQGIAATFRFASPGNKMMTGPLDRFIEMVKSPAYAPMLNFKKAEFDELRTDGNVAEQVVKLTTATGEVVYYAFRLSRQDEGEFKDCWMTDGVMSVEPIPPPATQPATRPSESPPIGVPV